MEAGQLKLKKQDFPLSISLRDRVAEKYGDRSSVPPGSQAMPRDELLSYLRNIDNFTLSPLEAVLAQTEIIGDPALPDPAETAALRWTGASFDLWERDFALEPALAMKLRQLQPVIAVAALSDVSFFTPGLHPLHRMLDTLHEAATGWQDTLGRAGEQVQQLVDKTVSDARSCLDTHGAGLVEIANAAAQSAMRIQSRAERMSQRTVESELGRLRAVAARSTAAKMINRLTRDRPVPREIAGLLAGPWYESAQLVLLKFGEASSQWQEMSATTAVLLDSFQLNVAEDKPACTAPQSAGLPDVVRRWLLSLQHDGEALANITSVMEYALARRVRGHAAEVETVAPISVPQVATAGEPVELPGVTTGQWYQVRSRSGEVLRVQLVLMQADQQQLLFCNQAGMKVQSLSYAAFSQLLEKQAATLLDTGASFSRALLAALGIDSPEAIAELGGGQMKRAGSDAAQQAPRFAADLPGEAVVRVGGPLKPAAVADDSAQAQGASPPAALEPLGPVEVEAEPHREPDLPDSGLPDLPMGTWLGFHDVNPPLLAKLALHDKVRRLLIFVNRKGVEQRRLGEDEYLELLQAGQVDIMEARNNFREQVERARRRMQHHQT